MIGGGLAVAEVEDGSVQVGSHLAEDLVSRRVANCDTGNCPDYPLGLGKSQTWPEERAISVGEWKGTEDHHRLRRVGGQARRIIADPVPRRNCG